MTDQGIVDARQAAQAPEELQVDTTNEADARSEPEPAGARTELTDRQRQVLFRVLRVAYPHDRFPDGPYRRTAEQVEKAAASSGGLQALAVRVTPAGQVVVEHRRGQQVEPERLGDHLDRLG